MQSSDDYRTYVNLIDIMNNFGFKSEKNMEEGLRKFANLFN